MRTLHLAAAVLLFSFPTAGGRAAAAQKVSLTLVEALRTSLANSPAVANALIAAGIAEKESQIADRERLPDVAFDAGYTKLDLPEVTDIPVPGFSLPDTEADVGVEASMPLYTGGRLTAGRQRASQGVELARARERTVRADILLETATAFYELFAAQVLMEIASESLASSEGHLADVRVLLAQGLVARVDLFRTELDVAERERDLASAEANLRSRAEHLSSLLFPDDIVEVEAAWEPPAPTEPETAAEWMETAKLASPELDAARLSLEVSRTGVEAARAERFPSLGLFGRYGSKDDKFSFDEEDRYWNAGLAFTVPLYTGGRTGLAIDSSRDVERQAANSLRLTRRSLRRSIVDAHSGALLAIRRHAAAEKAITAAGENLRVTRLKYSQGLIANTDVIDALLSLSRARYDKTVARKDYYINTARLMRLAGTIEELP